MSLLWAVLIIVAIVMFLLFASQYAYRRVCRDAELPTNPRDNDRLQQFFGQTDATGPRHTSDSDDWTDSDDMGDSDDSS